MSSPSLLHRLKFFAVLLAEKAGWLTFVDDTIIYDYLGLRQIGHFNSILFSSVISQHQEPELTVYSKILTSINNEELAHILASATTSLMLAAKLARSELEILEAFRHKIAEDMLKTSTPTIDFSVLEEKIEKLEKTEVLVKVLRESLEDHFSEETFMIDPVRRRFIAVKPEPIEDKIIKRMQKFIEEKNLDK